jgi:hypothetical protein
VKAFFAPCGHGAKKSVVTTGKINAALVHLVPAGRTHIVRLQRGTIWVPIKAMGGASEGPGRYGYRPARPPRKEAHCRCVTLTCARRIGCHFTNTYRRHGFLHRVP